MKLLSLKLLLIGVVLFFGTFLLETDVGSVSPFSALSTSRSFEKPPLKVSATIVPEFVTPGSVFRLHVQVLITSDSHIYSLEEGNEDLATLLNVDSPVLKPKGDWQESTPQVFFDEVLQKTVKMHENLAEFMREFETPSDLRDLEIFGKVTYRLCDNRICALPKIVRFRTSVSIK